MNKYICIHGHFYQPPRENPWLNEVELQESAAPYHDWNERISDECYARNSASRILNGNGNIVDIINNYSYISFNFGPTLLEWMQKKDPATYQAILDADKQSIERFSGHGSALAQVYNHIIMPLANERDKHTQVIWGMYDFKKRFSREPEGMWLAETAADVPTLEVLAAHGIKFTILSPFQAKAFRKIGDKQWTEAEGGSINPRRPYVCQLPSGKQIVLFFYDGPVSQGIAFEGLLERGEDFAHRLSGTFDSTKEPQLMHIATDGETYGHHHRFGEMALSYAIHHIEEEQLAQITVYGEFLEKYPPKYEAQIIEPSSWSCAHGVERWRSNCGCNTGGHPSWNQEWRKPIRETFDWLRDQLIPLYEQEMKKLGAADPWAARNDYIQVIMDRSEENVTNFIKSHVPRELTKEEQVRFLKLMEMQYHTLLLYTSCGWFFDEVTGIETLQDILYAARAMQLAHDLGSADLEPELLQRLSQAKSNYKKRGDAAQAYIRTVKPTMIDLLRVGAHYAVASLFQEFSEVMDLYSYTATSEANDYMQAGKQKLAIGRAVIKSKITWEQVTVTYSVLHLGDHQLFGGVREFMSDEEYERLGLELKTAFERGYVSEGIMLLDKHFSSHNYSFWHLFKDDQKKILDQVLSQTMESLENDFQQLYDNNYALISAIQTIGMQMPRPLQTTVEYIVNTHLLREFESEEPSPDEIKRLLQEVQRMSVTLNYDNLEFALTQRVDILMKKIQDNPQDIKTIDLLISLLQVMQGSKLQTDYWQAQNIAFRMQQNTYKEQKAQSEQGNPAAAAWCKKFETLYENLNLKL
ncbi:DUF3536 domain-containing protein [Pontibacter mangrovi]|uniref:DUF3536 domain-containing protein n=1 Tax=Pontibacter mangrovi TaxID=2589816 RepID=A0A501W2P6_9BACT|nr:DUF3536 domain-containing protein [Pontibacter mangrovi]TPE42905.1 DUF3536 domain-containing protein [Pontibacter mangrovi]